VAGGNGSRNGSNGAKTVVVLCPKCGHFLGEMGNFLRVRCCGYEIIVSALRPEPLTRSVVTT
jgi:hypothetical protein